MTRLLTAFVAVLSTALPSMAAEDDAQLRLQATEALRRATDFFTAEVSTEGGYLWKYSEDLTKREGEGKADDTMVWVQPPGTPTVGLALLAAYRSTGDGYYLEAARRAAYCLVRGQLHSGGWDYRIEFDPDRRKRYAYRVDSPGPGDRQRNVTTLDDNNTQSALRFLIALDETLEFTDAKIHNAVEYGIAALLAEQYPNGAWPQRFTGEGVEPPPVKRASYPDSWQREYPGATYMGFYTFNDNALADTIALMFQAAGVLGDPDCSASARRGGDFILLSQMPDPQPGWAQQYDTEMHPAWARKFEPPSVTGGESQGVMLALMQVYRETGDKKYLAPIPGAVDYYRRSLLPDGQLARFYELKTNRPLYFTKDYKLTYSDADMPTHYAFKVSQKLDRIERDFQKLMAADWKSPASGPPKSPGKASPGLVSQVSAVIGSLDNKGRWVITGPLKNDDPGSPTPRVIDCRTFVTNVGILSAFLATAPN